jgi:hypothetical protein
MEEKPRLIYGASIQRGRFFKRFLRAAFLVLVVAGAYLALVEASARGLADPLLLDIGMLAAILLAGLLSVRGLYNLVMALARRRESVRIYDQGIVWTRGNQKFKYAWHQLVSYREGTRGIYLARWPLFQWGQNRFMMADGQRFRYNQRFGDTRAGSDAARRYAAYVTGVHMGRTLRAEQAVKLHPKLTIYPTGIEAGKQDVHWSEADVQLDGDRLIIKRLEPNGRFKTIGRFPQRDVDNVGGFLEVAEATIRNYQPERFRGQRA